jgi:hypothetical protein
MSREVIDPSKVTNVTQYGTNQVNVGKSLRADRRTKTRTTVPMGQGDRDEEKRI